MCSLVYLTFQMAHNPTLADIETVATVTFGTDNNPAALVLSVKDSNFSRLLTPTASKLWKNEIAVEIGQEVSDQTI